MGKVVNMHEAKSTLSRLVEEAAAGEEIVIARAGEPVARLVAIERQPRRLGRWKGRVQISRDFDAPLPSEELEAWLGRK